MKRGIAAAAITILGTLAPVFGQYIRDTDYSADQSLKSNARVNPSTLAMDLSIPIGGYAGRGGNALPVVFNYSSKVWQIHYMYSWESSWFPKSDTKPMFAKRTAAGWTSNLGVPRIDHHFQMYKPFVGLCGSIYDGEPFDIVVGTTEPPPECQGYPIYYVKRMFIVMPDGSSHEFRKDDAAHNYGTPASPGGPGLPDQMGTFLSVDGSRLRFERTETQSTLFMPDGSRYLFGTGTTATTFLDRNGNKMSYDISNRRWTDTMGRVIDDPMPMNWQDFEQSQVVEDKIASFPSIDGGTMNVTLSWRYLKDPSGGESGLEDTTQTLHNLSNVGCQGNANRQIDPPHLFTNPEISIARVCNPIGWSGMDWWPMPPFNPVVLTKITLPNGQTYEFKYNVYGEIIKIIYPTGAYERFQYGILPMIQPQGSSYDQANRGVIGRWISEKGDGSDEISWTYSATHNYQQPYTIETTAPDGTKTQRFVHHGVFETPKPYGFGDEKMGMPYEELVLSPTDQILRRKLTSYEVTGPLSGGRQEATRDVRPNREISIIFEPGNSYALASMTETVYDTSGSSDPAYFSSLNPKQSKTYDYVVVSKATAESATITTATGWFSSASPATVTEIDYLYDPNYKARNINGLVTETRVKDSAGNVRARTQISYDDSGHTETSSGTMPTAAANSWLDPLTELGSMLGAKRGLPTTVRGYYDIANGYYIETKSFYDQFGNVRKSRDGRGNDSWVEYDDDYAFAYPTKSISAVPDSTGTHGSTAPFETSVTYDYNTGLPLTSTDANGQTSTMEYNDPLLRPTRAIAPNGHQTITEYGAGTSDATRWVMAKSQIDDTNWKEGISWFDGLGRTIKSQSVDSNGDVFVETEYDNMGRPKRTTNPYRDGDTIYWTESFYDDLSRVTKLKTPDNAEVNTAYGLATGGSVIGTSVTVTDQAGKLRRSVTNALGQLKRVDEPNDAGQLGAVDNPNQWTGYSYDLLNNLITVNQGVQTRSFTYDALSRLKSATNPESGLIQYGYDNNGNLTTKTDARNITTTYVYDNLNRVKTRNYSGESGSTTPNVSYFYDNLTNAKGQLIKVSSSVSTTEYTSFDILGRVTGHKQTTDGGEYETDYTYNLSGALIEQTYPSGRVVKNVLDNNGDLSIVQSKKSPNHGYWNYAGSFTYNAAGAVTSMQLGNGRWESTQFNSRLQPTQIALGATPGETNLLRLGYSYGDWNGSTIDATKNNGNVAGQTITVTRPGQSDLVFDQKYTYDTLNRITSAEEKTGTTVNWNQTYTFDRYGNRNFNESLTTTLPKNCIEGGNPAVCVADKNILNPSLNPANNRMASGQGWTYDAAGNVITDAEGRQFSYDAENKQKEVKDSLNQTIGEYFFDGDGKRIKKVVPSAGEVTIFVYDAGGKLVAEYSTVLSQEPKVQYLTNDHLGSPRINTDQNGNVTSRTDYRPYGEEIIGLGGRTANDNYVPDDVRQGFTGYENDAETGLDFAQARIYGSNLGRFSGPDDILKDSVANDPQSWNKYIYVRNNPLNLVDPSGEKAEVTITTDKKNKTGTILIKASFGIYAQDGKYTKKELEQQGALLKAQIEETYKGGFIKDGITYTVSASVTTQVYESEDAAVAAGTSGEVDNIVGLRNASSFQGNFGNGRTTRYSGYGYNVAGDNFDRMVIATGSKELNRSTLYAHEFGHLMGDIGHLPDGLKEGLMRPGGGNPPKIAGRYLTSQDFDLILARPIANHITGTGGPFAQEPRPIRPAIRMNLYPRSTTREVVRAATVNVWFSR